MLCLLSEVLNAAGDSLHQAQLNKLDAMIRTACITAGDHVLEIGCGWGSMAIRAAQTTGCRWTGITVSKEQLAEATARVEAAGLTDRIALLFCDYRCGCVSYVLSWSCCYQACSWDGYPKNILTQALFYTHYLSARG